VVATILQDNSKIAATCPCNRKFNNFFNAYKTLSQNTVPQKDGCIHNETKERNRSAGHGNKTAWEHKIWSQLSLYLFTDFFFSYNTCFNITDTVLLVIKHHIIFGVCLTSNVKFIKVMEQKLRT